MAFDDIPRSEDAKTGRRERLIGAYIGILAVLLAVCSLGGGNAAQDATLNTIQASNIWAFFQAKNIRRQAYRLQAAEFEAALAAQPNMPEEARKLLQAKIDEYKAQDKRLTSEPEKNEGIEELSKRGRELEAARDEALKRNPYFDYGQALLQIAIVLASVAIIAGGNALLAASGLVGLLGIAATVGGFTLAFPLPFAS